MTELIEIPVSEYAELVRMARWLKCLEMAGVDNWDGYDEARKMFKEGSHD